MSVASYIFGGDTGLSYEQLQKRRQVLEAMQQRSNSDVPRNVGEGIASLGQALARRMESSSLDSEEAAMQTEQAGWNTQLGDAQAALLAPTVGPGAGFAGATGPIADATTPSTAIPQGEIASYVKNGLEQRGLPSHVADAFLANFQDESGLNPGINEAKPLVPGSRGGYGLYQLTGPRRRAYEAFAQERGIDPSNVDGQLDFLMTELQGPEAGAAKSILAAPDTASAAQAIVNNFLRPASEHRQSRAARYAGLSSEPVQVASADPSFMPEMPGSTPAATPNAALVAAIQARQAPQLPAPQAVEANPVPPQDPMAGLDPRTSPEARAALASGSFDGFASGGGAQQVAQALPPPSIPAAPSGGVAQVTGAIQQAAQARGVDPRVLIGIANNPRATDGQRRVAQALLSQQMEQQQLQQQQAFKVQQTAEERRYEQMTTAEKRAYEASIRQEGYAREDSKPIEVGGVLLDRRTMKPVYEAPAKPTADMQEFDFAQRNGYKGDFVQFQLDQKKAGAASTTINNGGDSGKFYEAADRKRGEAFASAADAGATAQRSMIQIGELEKRLGAVGTGGMASVKQMAANLGIPVEGADDIQAATAIINQLVPGQRPPGSGTMSDADVELFKQSLPRIINSEGGNAKILATMRGIAQYDAQRGAIANQVLNREITPAEGQTQMNAIPNPLAGMARDTPTPTAAVPGKLAPGNYRWNPQTNSMEPM